MSLCFGAIATGGCGHRFSVSLIQMVRLPRYQPGESAALSFVSPYASFFALTPSRKRYRHCRHIDGFGQTDQYAHEIARLTSRMGAQLIKLVLVRLRESDTNPVWFCSTSA